MNLDLLFYIDEQSGLHVYRLLLDGGHVETVTLRSTEPADRDTLDSAKAEWVMSQHAADHGDVMAALSFTWRGLRHLFPQLPAEPLERNQG